MMITEKQQTKQAAEQNRLPVMFMPGRGIDYPLGRLQSTQSGPA